MRPDRIEPGEGQESVWDYPRPPRVEPTEQHITVSLHGRLLADTRSALRVLETSQPPAYYLPRDDIDMELLVPALGRSFCEWKGEASYFDVVLDPTHRADQAAWTYTDPTERFASIRDHIAFYAQKLDCTVDGEAVQANQGTFYGGWITSKVVGPFKGGPGSSWW